MPYKITDPNLPSNVKKLPAKKKKAWVATWNNVYDRCISGGSDKKTCEANAFKIANGNAKKTQAMEEEETGVRTIFRKIFDGFLDSIGIGDGADDIYSLIAREKSPIERVISISRIAMQVRDEIHKVNMGQSTPDMGDMGGMEMDSGMDWCCMLDIYPDGNNLFAIVAQSGKLYRVPVTVTNDEVSLGQWTQVEEQYTPVPQQQQSFRVHRQKDGKYRWTAIAGTTVLNRVGEIDSSELFDSFIEYAARTGDYPRLDFYHLGIENPQAWEFGTADYLAREGVCYIASGVFDEDHPLAQATIRSCENGKLNWGNSVEFYASAKEELVVVNPEVKVPMYKRGRNSRISLVLEEDAAGLFTQYAISQEVTRTMDQKTREKLTALYGGDEAGLKAFLDQFETQVDGVNRTVKDKNLIHRAADAQAETEVEDETAAEDETEDGDEVTIEEVIAEVVQSKEFTAMAQGIANLQKMVGELLVERENDKNEIVQLKQSLTSLSKDEAEKKQEFLQDLPRNKRTVITHRPREMNDALNGEKSMDTVANRTLNGIPAASRY